MGFTDTLRLVTQKLVECCDELTDKQRDELKKRFKAHKQYLKKAMQAIDQGLKVLAEKPKPKKIAKRRTARRRTKR